MNTSFIVVVNTFFSRRQVYYDVAHICLQIDREYGLLREQVLSVIIWHMIWVSYNLALVAFTEVTYILFYVVFASRVEIFNWTSVIGLRCPLLLLHFLLRDFIYGRNSLTNFVHKILNLKWRRLFFLLNGLLNLLSKAFYHLPGSGYTRTNRGYLEDVYFFLT